MKYCLVIICALLSWVGAQAQAYEVAIEPIQIANLGGLQSYAVGTHSGEWLLVGGRLDGLHQRQPFASFSADGKNQDLIVVNPATRSVWRAPLSSLPASISEQLSSTNMQFHQSDNKLLCTGGYGYSPSAGDHITYPYLTVIDLPKAIQSVKVGSVDPTAFAQIGNEAFRVTGGALNKIEDIYYLVGGHTFMGRYNPMGPTHGPGFEQEYTDEIRRFSVTTEPIAVEVMDPIHDEMNLHRRDYNLTPYLADGQRELMIYSGVFQNTIDLPWLYPVSISKDGHTAIEDFNQYYNHYHCPYLPIYNEAKGEMNTVFFGGIAQFYEEGGWLVQDNDVPFVNTIAEVRQDLQGVLTETILPDTMPGLLGAGSVFILNDDTELADDGILDAAAIGNDFEPVGYIYGGIRSSLPHVFWINTGTESSASSTVYQVSIRKRNTLSTATTFNTEENLQFYPNPAQSLIRMAIHLDRPIDINVSIANQAGMQIGAKSITAADTKAGKNIFVLDNINIGYGAFYYTVTMGSKVLTRKVIWSE